MVQLTILLATVMLPCPKSAPELPTELYAYGFPWIPMCCLAQNGASPTVTVVLGEVPTVSYQ